MLKAIAFSSFIAIAMLIPAVAQNAAPPADQGSPPADQGPPPGPMGGAPPKGSAKARVKDCQSQAEAQGLKRGPERRAAVTACIAAQRPDVAARRECRQQAKSQGLKDEGEIKTFVKNCLAKGGK
jgi:hypothetical protein